MKRTLTALCLLTAACSPAPHLPPMVGLALPLSGEPCKPAMETPERIIAAVRAQFEEDRTEPPPAITPDDRAAFQAMTERQRAEDWANLCHYRFANGEVRNYVDPKAVVLMGDSITQSWQLAEPGDFNVARLNRGISGQTTPQMLVRFRRDVIDLKPAAVHILAGVNDIAGNTGPTTLTDATNNIRSMVELAQANGITVILATPLPADRFSWAPDQKPAEAIATLAAWIRRYAAEDNLVLADYYPAFATAGGGMKPELSLDGVHPNKAGYAVMKPILEAAIARAILP